MRPHRVQQPQITTPTGSIPNAYNGYPPYSGPAAVVSHHSHDISVALAILLFKKPSKGSRIYYNNTFKGYFSSLRNFQYV